MLDQRRRDGRQNDTTDDPDKSVEEERRPDHGRESFRFFFSQELGDEFCCCSSQSHIEKAEVADDHPDKGQDSEPLCPQAFDDDRDGYHTYDERENLSSEVEDCVAG